MGDNAFSSLSLASPCLPLHVNKAPVNPESFGRQLECCPFISSPGALIKYPHLVGNKIQSIMKTPGCWRVPATRQSHRDIIATIGDARILMGQGLFLYIFPALGSLATLLPCHSGFPPQHHQTGSQPKQGKMFLNMTKSNTITFISYFHFPRVVAPRADLLFSPPLLSLSNKNKC